MTTLFRSLLAVVLLGQAQPEPARTVAGTVVDEEGKPVAGATVELPMPATPYLTRDTAPARATTLTDGDGRFELKLPPGRVVTRFIWVYQPGRAVTAVSVPGEVAKPLEFVLWKAEPRTVKVEGPDGKPVAGALVEARFGNQVGFKDGPVRSGADGAFQTPDCLMIGSSYRAVVREPGKEPITSDWVEITERPVTLAPLGRRALSVVTGRAIDRQGKPIADVEIFEIVQWAGSNRPNRR